MGIKNFSYDEFLKYASVSRETFFKLQKYVEFLQKWQKTINLVAAKTLEEVWTRHIIDSAQLIDYMPAENKVFDLGSGAGFPGLILAIIGRKNIVLVESDGRKVAFLNEAARVMETEITVVHRRVESIDIQEDSLIIARGFAPLKELLGMLENTLKTSNNMLLLKGKSYKLEIDSARVHWSFEYDAHASVTDKDGVILSLKNIQKRGLHE